MLSDLLLFLAIYGLVFLLKDSEILNRPRFWIVRRSIFIHDLLDCVFCTGFHAGWIVFLLSGFPFSVSQLIIWALAGGASSYIIERMMHGKS